MPWRRGKLHLVTVYVARGLTRAEALRRAKLRANKEWGRGFDYRGFTYDRETGRATFM